LPHFDYCSLVWDIGNAYSLEKLQKLQNRAARVIIGKSYDVRSKDILEELSWQPLMERWGNNKAIFMHKVTNGESFAFHTEPAILCKMSADNTSPHEWE
jgi:hypothetical protein